MAQHIRLPASDNTDGARLICLIWNHSDGGQNGYLAVKMPDLNRAAIDELLGRLDALEAPSAVEEGHSIGKVVLRN